MTPVGAVRVRSSKSAMVRRPIIWGLIFFGIGAVGWVLSVVLAVVTLGQLSWLANFFGWFAAGSLPAAVIGELILWIKNRNKKTDENLR